MSIEQKKFSTPKEEVEPTGHMGRGYESLPKVEFRSVQVEAQDSSDALASALRNNPGYRPATFKEMELAANNPEQYPELLEGNTYGSDRAQRLWVFSFEVKKNRFGKSTLLVKGMFFKYGVWLPVWNPAKAEERHWDAPISRVLLVKESDSHSCGCTKKKREKGLSYICACLNPVETPDEQCAECAANQHKDWMYR